MARHDRGRASAGHVRDPRVGAVGCSRRDAGCAVTEEARCHRETDARSLLRVLPEGWLGGLAWVPGDTSDEEVAELEARGARVVLSVWVRVETWEARQ